MSRASSNLLLRNLLVASRAASKASSRLMSSAASLGLDSGFFLNLENFLPAVLFGLAVVTTAVSSSRASSISFETSGLSSGDIGFWLDGGELESSP